MLFNHSHHLCLSFFFSLVQLLLFLDFDLAVILGHTGSSQLILLSTIANLSIVLSTMIGSFLFGVHGKEGLLGHNFLSTFEKKRLVLLSTIITT